MKGIDDLPEELLVMIFKNVESPDRLKCKEVSTQWFRILMEEKCFSMDRHICLKQCVMDRNKPPMSIFMNSTYAYERVTFSYGLTYGNVGDYLDFIKKLGQNVKHVKIVYELPKLFEFLLEEMQLVESMTFQLSTETGLFKFSSTLKSVKGQVLKNLKLIQFDKVSVFEFGEYVKNLGYGIGQLDNFSVYQFGQSVKVIRKMIPINTRIMISAMTILVNDWFIEPFSALTVAFVDSVHIEHLNIVFSSGSDTSQQMENLINVPKLSCEYLTMVFGYHEAPFELIKIFLEKNSQIKNVKVKCENAPPDIQIPQITDLELVELKTPVFCLGQFENLSRLSFQDRHDQCYFGHDLITVKNQKIKSLDLGLRSIECIDCIETTIKSFPGLQSITASIKVKDITIIERMLQTWTELTDFNVKVHSKTNIELMPPIFNELPKNTNMKKFSLAYDEGVRLPNNIFENIVQVFPNVEHLTLDYIKAIESSYSLVSALIPGLQHLKILVLKSSLCFTPLQTTDIELTKRHLIQHGYELNCIDDLPEELLVMIFKNVESPDRLKCKEVSTQWFRILMEEKCFSMDRHIYMRCRRIERNKPPMSVFMNSTYAYERVTFNKGLTYHNVGDYLDFIKKLGQNVRHVKIVYELPQMFEFLLEEMPLIESITFELKTADGLFNKFSSTLKSLKGQVLKNLKLIQIDKIQTDENNNIPRDEFEESVEVIRKIIPINTRIIISSMTIMFIDTYNEPFDFVQIVHLNMKFSPGSDTSQQMQKLINVPKFSCESLTMEFKYYEAPFELIKIFLEKNSQIKDVKVICQNAPPTIQIPQITCLELVNLRSPVFCLDQFENLSRLSFQNSQSFPNIFAVPNIFAFPNIFAYRHDQCYFGHDLTTVNIKSLDLGSRIECFDCIETMIKSFPGLQNITGLIKVKDITVVQRMLQTWTELTDFNIKVKNENLEAMPPILNGKNNNMKKLSLAYAGGVKLPNNSFDNVVHVFPNLEHLTLDNVKTIESLYSLVSALIPDLQNLKLLGIKNCSPHRTLQTTDIELTKTHLIQHGYELFIKNY
uniref:CSON010901 protein n=1 Tax=Culicoides sonorensis TaxID=179676 RepID=A0A336M2T1_CULSO